MFELVVGETGLVLGERFSSDEFAEEVLRRWRESEGSVAQALAGLGVQPILHLTPQLSAPLLGLFGAEDGYPSPDEVAQLEAALKENNKPYEIHSFENAGHAFFATDRPSYRVEAANAGWAAIWAFFGEHLA